MPNWLFKFPTDANYYTLAEAARRMRLPVAQLEEMVHATEVDHDVVGWTCHKGHDGTWRLSLLGAFDMSSNKSEDMGGPTDLQIRDMINRATQEGAKRRRKRST